MPDGTLRVQPKPEDWEKGQLCPFLSMTMVVATSIQVPGVGPQGELRIAPANCQKEKCALWSERSSRCGLIVNLVTNE